MSNKQRVTKQKKQPKTIPKEEIQLLLDDPIIKEIFEKTIKRDNEIEKEEEELRN